MKQNYCINGNSEFTYNLRIEIKKQVYNIIKINMFKKLFLTTSPDLYKNYRSSIFWMST